MNGQVYSLSLNPQGEVGPSIFSSYFLFIIYITNKSVINFMTKVWVSNMTLKLKNELKNDKLFHLKYYLDKLSNIHMYEGNSISKLQIQVATYVFELSAGNCHR